jgi:hypothetical protein
VRERDRECFKRNNPRAYELIQRQREQSEQRVVEQEERKRRIRMMQDG